MLHIISRKVNYMKIAKIVPKTNLLIYIIPPLNPSSNMFADNNLDCVILKLTNTFKDTFVSRIINGNN